MNAVLVLAENDNVATCTKAVTKNTTVQLEKGELKVLEDIPIFHKVAIAAIPKGGTLYKYGESIGVATSDIATGEYVHIHNLESRRGRGDKGRK